MNFLNEPVSAWKVQLRHYEVTSARETAEIRNRLLRGIRARFSRAPIVFFGNDARKAGENAWEVGEIGWSTGRQGDRGD